MIHQFLCLTRCRLRRHHPSAARPGSALRSLTLHLVWIMFLPTIASSQNARPEAAVRSTPPSGTVLRSKTSEQSVDPQSLLRFEGPRYRGTDGRLIVGPTTDLVLDAEGARSTPRQWQLLLDGEETTIPTWKENLATGGHVVEVIAVDSAGNEERRERLPFLYDPNPPVLSWGPQRKKETGRVSGTPEAPSRVGARRSGPRPELSWSSNAKVWIPMEDRKWRYFADKPWLVYYRSRSARRTQRKNPRHLLQGSQRSQTVRVDFNRPRFILRTDRKKLRIAGIDERISPARGLWIEALEDSCRVETLTFRLAERSLPAPDGATGFALEVEAVDSVGNRTRIEWPVLHQD